MLHAAPPLEVGGAGAAHTRCLLRDRGGHGAVPADPLPLYGDDAATTKFLLERVLRGSSIAPYLPSSASSASSSTAAADADPAEREDEDPEDHRCLLRDLGGHGATPADPFPRYGDDAATTKFLLERVLRGSSIAPYLPSSASSASSSTAAVDADPAEREDEDPGEPASGLVPSARVRGDGTTDASGAGAAPETALQRPLESAASAPASCLPALLGPEGRILIVANRLPVTVKRLVDGWDYSDSSGGLVSALRGVTGVKMTWVGWPGVSIPDKEEQTIVMNKLMTLRCFPIFMDQELVDQYYSGYCNNILWPLFHYMGLPQDYRFNKTKDYKSQLKAYEKANQMFADVVCQIYEKGDIVWCHDYHLMLLPSLLKKHDINMKVGWFLHTPFPSSEIYRALPNRMDLLKAVLKSDLVGFHTYDYARHFVSACTSLLGLESYLEGVEVEGRVVKVEAFPIGIDFSKFKDTLERPDVKAKIADFKSIFAGRQVMLGVDRFDMIKGLLQKVLAFEKYLEENTGMNEKVVLLQIAVPTRSDVPEYRRLASQVHELVARVNGRFGTIRTTPIHHLDQTVDFPDLCALYAVTDVALVTSLRDGMNLVSYEYVACQESNKGVLILSEFAGAAQSLGAGAIIVNPWDTAEVANSIKAALAMPAHDREERHRHNYKLVSAYSAQNWAEDYVSELHKTATKAPVHTKQPIVVLPIEEITSRYAQSRSRLLILGFHETLTEQVQSFEIGASDQTASMKLKLNPEFKGPLKTLCDDKDTTVIVVSGYGRIILEKNFGEFEMWLAAENGMFLRRTTGEWMTTATEHLEIGCSDSVKKVIEYFTRRTPNSYLEQRGKSFVWNYKYSDDDFGRNQAKDMLQHLGSYSSSNRSADIVQGRRSIEGNAVNEIIKELGRRRKSKNITTPIDFVLCIGHFLAKDEDVYTLPYFIQRESEAKAGQEDCTSIMFDGLKAENYFSCTVGRECSRAKYKLEGTSDVVTMLRGLANPEASLDIVDDDGSQL
ncbi:probable alpha,alpha-trehalose-phosphate synthase [UDP-forming] 2 isoform X2 [Lolium perenne]|uniref:probable alpha,alpha-trehalose-phosphate synthase [UDP-forming] 2 isoform X2 n=1 Tax=Lolium perenne TaxID=4522 RepID=UPI0021F61243|nr:alpha,alpha-trehalose-phosphate synthase [UDP-forming] 1-like isoform X2 [Lolium perenne]